MITNKPNGLISTSFVEKTVNLSLSSLSAPSGGNAAMGISNAVLRLINPNFQGYLTLSATNYVGNESAGFISLRRQSRRRQLRHPYRPIRHHQWPAAERKAWITSV